MLTAGEALQKSHFMSPSQAGVVNLGDVNWLDLSYAFEGANNLTEFNSKHTDTSNVSDTGSNVCKLHTA